MKLKLGHCTLTSKSRAEGDWGAVTCPRCGTSHNNLPSAIWNDNSVIKCHECKDKVLVDGPIVFKCDVCDNPSTIEIQNSPLTDYTNEYEHYCEECFNKQK